MLPLMRSPERGIASSVEGGCERRAARRGWPPRTACGQASIRKTIATKVLPPRCVGLIERPRLLEFVSQGQMKRLSVIKAPAGFGKTSLAAAWADRLLQRATQLRGFRSMPMTMSQRNFCSMSPTRYTRAYDGLGRPAINLIQETSLIRPHAIISTLINDLAEIDEEVCLFLEDYHWIRDPAIHEAVAFLLRHAPSHFHLVLITRTEPPLPLAGLRAQNQLLEIDSLGLRFDQEETRRFLEHEGLGPLDPAELRLLHEKTEGWPAGTTDRSFHILSIGTEFRRSTSGSYPGRCGRSGPTSLKWSMDFRTTMTLFMLRTAVLDKFSASLCQAIIARQVEPRFLELIANRQLLLVPLDHRGSLVSLSYSADRIFSSKDGSRTGERGNCYPSPAGRRTGTPRRNYGLKLSSMRSQQAIQSKPQVGSRTAPWRWSRKETC